MVTSDKYHIVLKALTTRLPTRDKIRIIRTYLSHLSFRYFIVLCVLSSRHATIPRERLGYSTVWYEKKSTYKIKGNVAVEIYFFFAIKIHYEWESSRLLLMALRTRARDPAELFERRTNRTKDQRYASIFHDYSTCVTLLLSEI